jgi:hypothetical protein
MKQILFFFIVVAIPFSLWGQEFSEKPSRKLTLSGIEVSGGVSHTMNYSQTFAQFQALVSHSEVLTKHPYEVYHTWPATYWTNSGVAGAALRFRMAKPGSRDVGKGPEFRLGIRYQGNHYHFLNTNHREAFLIDSLYNGQGEVIGHIDSVESHFYTLLYKSDQLHVDFSMIYSTRPDLRFTLFGGIGVAGGFSTRSWLQVNQFTRTYSISQIQGYGYAHHYQHYFYLIPQTTREQAPGNAGGIVYLPMGLRFRPGKSDSEARHLQLFYELQPGIHWMKIKGSDPLVQTGVNQRIGISLNW